MVEKTNFRIKKFTKIKKAIHAYEMKEQLVGFFVILRLYRTNRISQSLKKFKNISYQGLPAIGCIKTLIA